MKLCSSENHYTLTPNMIVKCDECILYRNHHIDAFLSIDNYGRSMHKIGYSLFGNENVFLTS